MLLALSLLPHLPICPSWVGSVLYKVDTASLLRLGVGFGSVDRGGQVVVELLGGPGLHPSLYVGQEVTLPLDWF